MVVEYEMMIEKEKIKKTLNVQYARNRCILKMIPKGTCIDI